MQMHDKVGTYLELLLCVGVAHAALLDHCPEGGVVEVVDMAWGVSHNVQKRGKKKKRNIQSTCLQLI